MIKLRDHYFIAWLKVFKNYNIIFNDGILVNMTPKEYTQALEEYDATLKPLLKEIRKTVKELAQYTAEYTSNGKKNK